jgi:ABC-type phosphate/phosphonate transport system substrate-binding protein
MFMTQTCGLPLVSILRASVLVVAVPIYSCPGCDGHLYCSAVVVRDGAAGRGGVVAKNDVGSCSGSLLLDALLATSDLPELPRRGAPVLYTGAHRSSLAAVKAGQADAAAIDCVTLSLLRRYAPAEVEGLTVVAYTPSAPALPFVTDASHPPAFVAALRAALVAVAADPALRPTLNALHITGFDVSDDTCTLTAYDAAIARLQRMASLPEGPLRALGDAAGSDSAVELAALETRTSLVAGAGSSLAVNPRGL